MHKILVTQEETIKMQANELTSLKRDLLQSETSEAKLWESFDRHLWENNSERLWQECMELEVQVQAQTMEIKKLKSQVGQDARKYQKDIKSKNTEIKDQCEMI